MITVQFNLMYQRQLNENIQVKIFRAGEFEKPLFTAFLNSFNMANVNMPIDLIQKGITYTYSSSASVNYHMYPLPSEEVNSDIYIYDDWPYPNNSLWRSMLISRLYQRQMSYDISNIYQNNQVNISFSVQVPVLAKNQLVYLLGNHEQLGAWNEDNKLLLYNPNKSSNVFQSLFITLPNQKTQIKYKYLLMDKVTGETIYEEGQDRIIDVVVQTNQLIQTHSFFRYKEFKTPKIFGVKVDLYTFKYKSQFLHIDIYDLVMLIPFFKETGTKMICPLQVINDDGFFNTDFIAMGLLDALSPELLSEIEKATDIDDYQKNQYLMKNYEDHFEKNIILVNKNLSEFKHLKVYCIYKYLQQKDLHTLDAQKLLNDPDYCDKIYTKLYNNDRIKLTFIAYEQIIMYQQIKFVCEEFRKNNISLQLELQYSRPKYAFMEKFITFQQFIGLNLGSSLEQFLVNYKTNQITQTNYYVIKKSIECKNLIHNSFVDQLFNNNVDSIILKDFSLYYSSLVLDQYGKMIPQYDVNMKYECLDSIKRYSLVLFQKYQLTGYDQKDIDALIKQNIIVYSEQYQMMQLIYNDIPLESLTQNQVKLFKDLFAKNVLLQYDPATTQYIPNYAFQSTKQYGLLKDSQKSQLNDYVTKYQHCLQEKQLDQRHKILQYLCQYDMQFIIEDELNETYSNAFYDNIFLTSKTHIQHIGDQIVPFSWDFSYYTQIEPYKSSLTKMWQNKSLAEQYLRLQLNKQDTHYYYADIKLTLYNIFEKYLYSSSFIVVMHLNEILLLSSQPVYNEEENLLASKGDEQYWKKYFGNVILKQPRYILPTQQNFELIQILKELLEKSQRYD